MSGRYTCLSYVGCGRGHARYFFCKANLTRSEQETSAQAHVGFDTYLLRSGFHWAGKLKPGLHPGVLGPTLTFFRLPPCLSQARSALFRFLSPIRFDHSQSQNPWGLFRLLSACKDHECFEVQQVNWRRRLGSELLTSSFVIPNHSHTRRARYPTAF